jgi:hypothetical protein
MDTLEGHLDSGAWEPLLAHVKAMIDAGLADKAVEEADPRDAYRAHPELVLLILRQRYIDLRLSPEAQGASDFYTQAILSEYPDGRSSGSVFADRSLLEGLRALAGSVQIPA